MAGGLELPGVVLWLHLIVRQRKEIRFIGGGGEWFLEACFEASFLLPEEEAGSLAAFSFLAQHYFVGSDCHSKSHNARDYLAK
ncbi:hypothetical protein DSO57_1021606 [Entomophthora muscae]|uniref:Uncharacterized protein n=1 Tax=Entomophthora muscae TaxID=34485 RepID=A0ACC2UQF6_9FUNG|nr:hypothetical protein DSO57_1021606 [Entomophthora muscae]